MLLIDLKGPFLTPEEREALRHPAVAGVVLFTRNYEDRVQLKALIREMRRLSPKPLLVTVDQEGGRVQRFREDWTRLPPVSRYGELYRQDPQLGRIWAERGGYVMAFELREVGVDLSLAPVVDIERGTNPIIGDRAFGSGPETVAELALAFMRGMRRAGMAAVAKHFPGHGAVAEDSHETLPIDSRDFEIIVREDLHPYRRLISEGLAGIMTAHVLYPEVDARPATFSRFWLREVLHQQLGFEGVVLSDDLSMAGASIAGTLRERVEQARTAGCDLLLLCNGRWQEVLDSVALTPNLENRRRLASLSGGLSAWFDGQSLERWRKQLEGIADGRTPNA